ncbi:hypothetical protein TeGR_g6138 [Tetraparma gracilis]|uniref:non-specific serine/threonine protein kinase n=1 Tax=Tetraparma gracilis TaxID=2962635 RepID=A0ABQ6M4L2_9STRA|nr:hypothetical protein TeGR_g6138 [Tetraparma gracilis]
MDKSTMDKWTKSTNLGGGGRLGPHDFHFLAQIGRGAFGTVYLAQEAALPGDAGGEVIAIKAVSKREMMSCKEETSMRHIRQLLDERNILAKVKHPFVVELRCFFQDESRLFFGMTLAESGDFFSVITKENKGNGLPLIAARFYAAELALALRYVHSLGVVYRDLKPENIMLRADGHLMLADFGLAKVQPSRSRTSSTVGTPSYFAPELVMNEKYGKEVDWWAYGVVVFELVSGQEPFRGRDIKATMKNVVAAKQKLPSKVEENARGSKKEVMVAQDFLDKLFVKNATDRLGALGGDDVKAHPFFKSRITMPGRSSSLSPATSPTIPVRDLPELPDVTASWTWEDLESKQIKPPLKRPNILEAPSMKALMAARRNRTGKTKMEELFTEFKDFNGISSETAFDAQRSPSHAAMPSYAGPDYGQSPTFSPRTKLEPIPLVDSKTKLAGSDGDTPDSSPDFANKTIVRDFPKLTRPPQDVDLLETVSDPVLRRVTYDFIPGHLATLGDTGHLETFAQIFREQAKGYIHFSYKVNEPQFDILTIDMVFLNHHYLDFYNRETKYKLVDLIRPHLQQDWAAPLREGENGIDMEGRQIQLGRPRNERIVWRSGGTEQSL